MNCSVCEVKSSNYNKAHNICCVDPYSGDYLRICGGCDRKKFFATNPEVKIRLYMEKGYTFDYAKEIHSARTIMKCETSPEFVVISGFELFDIVKLYEMGQVGYISHVEIEENGKKISFKYCDIERVRMIYQYEFEGSLFVPTKELFIIKEQQLIEQSKVWATWKSSLNIE